jgi:hypothetical protein
MACPFHIPGKPSGPVIKLRRTILPVKSKCGKPNNHYPMAAEIGFAFIS